MNSEHIKNNDPLQLKQMIIFLKAELAKHKYEVKKYQNSFHYSFIENLEQENILLTKEKTELAEEVARLNQEFEKRKSDDKEPAQWQGMLGKRYIASIDTLWNTKTDLRPINKQLAEIVTKMKDEANANQYRTKKHDRKVTSLHKKLSTNKTTIQQLEYKLVDVIQDANKQVMTQVEKLEITQKERAQSEKVRQDLLKELEEKNTIIGELQHEISDLKEQIQMHKDASIIVEKSRSQNNDGKASPGIFSSISTPTIDAEELIQLDHQIKEVIEKSLEYEAKLDAKLLVIHTLEHKLNQLTEEIDSVKVSSKEGGVFSDIKIRLRKE